MTSSWASSRHTAHLITSSSYPRCSLVLSHLRQKILRWTKLLSLTLDSTLAASMKNSSLPNKIVRHPRMSGLSLQKRQARRIWWFVRAIKALRESQTRKFQSRCLYRGLLRTAKSNILSLLHRHRESIALRCYPSPSSSRTSLRLSRSHLWMQ